MMPFPPPEIVAPAPIGTIPPCPNAHLDFTHEIRTYAGAGGERRTYNCTCGMTWNQKRPDKLSPGEDPDVRQSNRAALGGAKRRGREYKCRTCGEPKKGHVCTVDLDVNKRAKTFSPSGAALPPMSPMRCEQYDEMLKFSSPPTDAEILAFLRKYDLRPSEATDLYKSMLALGQAATASVQQGVPPPVPEAVTTPVELTGLLAVVQSMLKKAIQDDLPPQAPVAPIEPAPVEPAPVEPAPVEPAPVEPAPVEPAPVELPPTELPPIELPPIELPPIEQAPEMDISLDDFLDKIKEDACAVCGADMGGDDRMTCNCGETTVHRSCFLLCPACN